MSETKTRPEISFADGFFESAARLAPADSRRVHKAIDQLRRDPDHSSLNLEPTEKVAADASAFEKR